MDTDMKSQIERTGLLREILDEDLSRIHNADSKEIGRIWMQIRKERDYLSQALAGLREMRIDLNGRRGVAHEDSRKGGRLYKEIGGIKDDIVLMKGLLVEDEKDLSPEATDRLRQKIHSAEEQVRELEITKAAAFAEYDRLDKMIVLISAEIEAAERTIRAIETAEAEEKRREREEGGRELLKTFANVIGKSIPCMVEDCTKHGPHGEMFNAGIPRHVIFAVFAQGKLADAIERAMRFVLNPKNAAIFCSEHARNLRFVHKTRTYSLTATITGLYGHFQDYVTLLQSSDKAWAEADELGDSMAVFRELLAKRGENAQVVYHRAPEVKEGVGIRDKVYTWSKSLGILPVDLTTRDGILEGINMLLQETQRRGMQTRDKATIDEMRDTIVQTIQELIAHGQKLGVDLSTKVLAIDEPEESAEKNTASPATKAGKALTSPELKKARSEARRAQDRVTAELRLFEAELGKIWATEHRIGAKQQEVVKFRAKADLLEREIWSDLVQLGERLELQNERLAAAEAAAEAAEAWVEAEEEGLAAEEIERRAREARDLIAQVIKDEGDSKKSLSPANRRHKMTAEEARAKALEAEAEIERAIAARREAERSLEERKRLQLELRLVPLRIKEEEMRLLRLKQDGIRAKIDAQSVPKAERSEKLKTRLAELGAEAEKATTALAELKERQEALKKQIGEAKVPDEMSQQIEWARANLTAKIAQATGRRTKNRPGRRKK